MSKSRFPWLLGGVLVVAWAGWHALGLVLAVFVLLVLYLGSVRLSPRTRHARCNGTGQKQGILFSWVHRRCGRCTSGRIIRWGARMWGAPVVRAEAVRTRRALRRARETHAWR